MRHNSGRRPVRVANLLQAELAELIRRELSDPRLEAITVTGVRVTEDFREARVGVSYFGPAEERDAVLDVLRRAAPFLRGLLGRRISLRRTPELSFEYDGSLDHGLRIQAILAELAGEREGAGEETGHDPGTVHDPDTGEDEGENDARDVHRPRS